MTELATTILYLSSSVRPSGNIPFESSPIVSLDLPSAIILGSTSVDSLSTYSSVTHYDDAHVNLSSHDDDSGHFTTSNGISSTSHPIFYRDDDIMEKFPPPTLSIPPYIEPMRSHHIHLVAITLKPTVWVRGHPHLRDQEQQFSKIGRAHV